MRKVVFASMFSVIAFSAFAHDGHSAIKGVVAKVDEATGKITLKHDAVPVMNMDAMTMSYGVKDPSVLKDLKAGDKVQFGVEETNGITKVTEIKKAN